MGDALPLFNVCVFSLGVDFLQAASAGEPSQLLALEPFYDEVIMLADILFRLLIKHR